MEQVFRLYAVDVVLRELPFFLIQGVVSKEAAKGLKQTWTHLVKEVALKTSDLLECLNVPTHALYAPIGADYIKYNESENQGEVVGAKM